MSKVALTIDKIENVTQMKPQFRADPRKELMLRQQTQDHLAYINSEKLWNVADEGKWGQRKNAAGQTEYLHFFQSHALTLTQTGPIENPVVTVNSTDSDGNICSMHISATAFGVTGVSLVIGVLALAVQIAFNQESVEAAVAGAAAILGAEVEGEAEITLAGAAGPIGIALAILAFIIVLGIFLGEREIQAHMRYENRSTRKTVSLIDCWTWNLPNIDAGKLEPVHSIDGFDVYDAAVYTHDNDRKTEGIGLSLLFQTDEGFANVCLRNDIHRDPSFSVASSLTRVSPEDFYYNMPPFTPGMETRWGSLVIKNVFDDKGFMNYKFTGIVSFHDA